ncbi:class II aldolase/adducin family protein [Actinomycetota bacterium]
MVDIKNIRKSIRQIGKLLFDRELVDSSGGNISVRDGDKIYVSPRRTGHDNQWEIDEDSIIVTDLCRVPVLGEADAVSREASTHYYIFQNFPDVGAVIHAHPIHIMSFGAAHMDLPAISEGTRAILGNEPITNVDEVLPGSREQAAAVVANFNNRRKKDPTTPLICGLPYHGTFAAGGNLNDAYLYTEVANNCAKILINRQIMFGNDPKADFSVHKQFTKEDFYTIDQTKEICDPGFVYRDAFGKETIYNSQEKKETDYKSQSSLIDKITEEVLKKLNNK